MPVLSGIDRVETVDTLLSSGRLGLLTNPSGLTRSLCPTVDVLHRKYRLTALFAAEHGIRGNIEAGEAFSAMQDPATGLPVFPLYGKTKVLTEKMLETFDIFCFDMQDVGARFYTFLYALSLNMEACCRAGKPVVVFDRINPLGGEKIQGTVLDPRFSSYVGLYPLPTRYGLTVGEYARWVKYHLGLENLELHVVPLEGWRRGMRPEEADLPWPAPSPNCPTFHSALAYVGTCIFEGTNLSEGRGTCMPFEYIGAPWIDADRLATAAESRAVPGIRFRPHWFTPCASWYAGEPCAGVQVHLTDPAAADPVAGALALLDSVRELYPEKLEWVANTPERYMIDLLLGTDDYRLGRMDGPALLSAHGEARRRFAKERQPFLLYD
jgi:uncharacterized protein YbbC (DUF1343 family)